MLYDNFQKAEGVYFLPDPEVKDINHVDRAIIALEEDFVNTNSVFFNTVFNTFKRKKEEPLYEFMTQCLGKNITEFRNE